MEKEKLILQQNEMLEIQVAQRTDELNQQKELIEVKNREILDSIHYAKRLQEAILPGQQFLSALFPDNFIIYYPKDIVAGDFYWFGQEDQCIIVAADCTGHGVSGALMSMLGISLLNQIISTDGITEPARILDHLHEAVIDALNQTENDSNEGMDICICKFDKTNHTMEFSGANRPMWIVRGNEILVFHPDKVPVGGLQMFERQNFTCQQIALQPGDRIYMFTDGYADQFGGEKGKKLMTRNLKEMLLHSSKMTMKEQSDYLKSQFQYWKGNCEQVDDVLMIGIAYNIDKI